MGLSKVKYEDIEEHPEVYGDVLPKWSRELSDEGYHGISAIDFYDDIFGDDLAEKRMPDDYKTGEYCGIVVEMVLKVDADGNPILNDKGKKQWVGRRTQVTQGNGELYDLIDRSENFCLFSPISYAGRQRTNENARYMYAFCIEVDDIQEKGGLNELIYSWERKNQPIPKPTYIVCSGNGLHLYYVFERPVPMWKNVFEAMSEYKKYLTPRIWTKYITFSYENIQWEAVSQPFRVVGTRTKNNGFALAFRIGDKVSIDYMNKFVPADKAMTCVYKPKCSLEEAKELYPDWYKRRIEEGKEKGHWNRYKPIYYNWIDKILKGAVVGKRYNCLENLCSLAVQCNIEPEQVEADCRRVAEYFETLTVDENNHFTEYDVLCALQTYHKAEYSAYARRIEFISKKTGIELIPNRRNGRKQDIHLERARAVQAIDYPDGEWRKGNGRPKGSDKKMNIIAQYMEQHPDCSNIAQIARECNVSRPSVYKFLYPEKYAERYEKMKNKAMLDELIATSKNIWAVCQKIAKDKGISEEQAYELYKQNKQNPQIVRKGAKNPVYTVKQKSLLDYYVVEGDLNMLQEMIAYASAGVRNVEVLTQEEYDEMCANEIALAFLKDQRREKNGKDN